MSDWNNFDEENNTQNNVNNGSDAENIFEQEDNIDTAEDAVENNAEAAVNNSEAENTSSTDGTYGFSYGHGGYKYNDDYVANNTASQSTSQTSGEYTQSSSSYTGSQETSENTGNASYERYSFHQTDNGQSQNTNDNPYSYEYWQQNAEQNQKKKSFFDRFKNNNGNGNKPSGRNSRGKYVGKLVASAAAFGLVAGLVFSGVTAATGANSSSSATTVSSSALATTSTSSATTVTDVSDIVEEVMSSVVQVTSVSLEEYRSMFGQSQTYESTSAGSGVIISSTDSTIYIATNNHVISGANSVTITFSDDSSVEASIVGTDSNHDLAVLSVNISDLDSSTLDEIKVATLGDSDDLKVGESTIVIGNALGYGQSVTTGVVSATSRTVSIEGDDGETITNDLIQTDAAVNPGNSGGALLNMSGEVIGIVSAKYSDTDVEGMGYAIPITQAKEIIESIIATGSYSDDSDSSDSSSSSTGIEAGSAYLGIYGADVTEDMSEQYNIPVGIYISQTVSGSPAAESGLSKGDIITSVDGTEYTSMSDLKSYISSLEPGDTIEITYSDASDDYAEVTVTVTLAEAE